MEGISYSSVVGSLMYVQTCTRPDISFAVGMLGRYQSNPGMDHWKAAKKVLRYLQGTKDYMLMYKRYSKGAKHMEIKYFGIKEEVRKQRVSIEHVRTELMIADPLTKGLQPKTFKEHVHRMGLGSSE
ncbi:uncharacterized protein LOC107615109 [Arachis ipaensis]|uniref:uncharacterized protein LOC107615109 n=1 Tax=Arachis ipaensis TaxID=130454 RepID=UPI0007AF0479|nr:uncharacterized protein LOC107615109 [Arachis ipaensis]